MNNLILRHWGIRSKNHGTWLGFDSNDIFWTTSRAVAEAQLSRLIDNQDWEVSEFESLVLLSVAYEGDSQINNGGKHDNTGHPSDPSGI